MLIFTPVVKEFLCFILIFLYIAWNEFVMNKMSMAVLHNLTGISNLN